MLRKDEADIGMVTAAFADTAFIQAEDGTASSLELVSPLTASGVSPLSCCNVTQPAEVAKYTCKDHLVDAMNVEAPSRSD